MKFEWDEDKNEINRKKHGIWFEEAQMIFSDRDHRVFLDSEHSINEERYVVIGHSHFDRLLIAIFCYRNKESVIRIISARKATKKERSFYEKRV